MDQRMKRREFITLAGGMAVWPLAARAQQAMPVIGYVAEGSKLIWPVRLSKALAEHGFVEGQNFRFEVRYANFDPDLVPSLFREFVEQKVSVIITGSGVQLRAAKAATQSIPIIFVIGIDPVENGFVASFKKPGGNITGIYTLNVMLADKRIQMLHELIPSVTKYAYITDPGNEALARLQLPQVQAVADSLGLSVLNVYAHTSDELERAFDAAVRGGAGGMVIGPDIVFYGLSSQLVALADRYRLPTMYMDSSFVIAGGLISYSTDQREVDRLTSDDLGRVLKGEKPADIPVLQAAKTILIINLKTAKALGITVPTPLLGRADEVIE
jgi:putative ABC transport system substrate-binding protein